MARSFRNPVLMPNGVTALRNRRRGSVLVLVMTVLAIVFVMGIAFLTTMNFEAEMISFAREREKSRPGIEDALGLDTALLMTPVLSGTDDGHAWEQEAAGALPDLSAIGFADTPGLYNFFAPIEPHEDLHGDLVFGWFTDLEALLGKSTDYVNVEYVPIDTMWPSGLWDMDAGYTRVDADGDGIVDALQVDLTDPKVNPNADKAGAQLAGLASVLNPPANPSGGINLALRVVPHGGLVNLANSHPTLIRNLFFLSDDSVPLPQQLPDYEPYSPIVEEASLRRRGGLLPPRVLPPTRLQGNPAEPDLDPEDDAGNGDFSYQLFAPGDSVWEHRYWPISPDEKHPEDPEELLWPRLLDPSSTMYFNRGTDYNVDYDHYDRRHLVTTISHDDLLRRATPATLTDQSSVIVREEPDVLELMKEANQPACGTGFPFEYANYPWTLANTYNQDIDPDDPVDVYDWCACAANEDCAFNPRKGRLRLSLAWLDEHVDLNIDVEKAAAIRLIQDAFTLMLLNARGSKWGYYSFVDQDDKLVGNPVPVKDTDGDALGLPDSPVQVWARGPQDFAAISRTAASLTANLIDFADGDDVPTQVELRCSSFQRVDVVGNELYGFGRSSCDPALTLPEMSACGFIACERVYGLERQPFITEVAADVKNTADSIDYLNSAWAVELFNPYDEEVGFIADIPGAQYSLRVGLGGMPIPLPKDILRGRFTVFKTDPGGLLPGPGSTGNGWIYELLVTTPLSFQPGDTIYLIRTLSYPSPEDPGTFTDVDIVVDQFKVSGTVGLMPSVDGEQSGVQGIQRKGVATDTLGTGLSPWLAPLPAIPEVYFGETLGDDNVLLSPVDPPVQVWFANVPGNTRPLTRAFPTTGSLLLLMRHANMQLTSANPRAFTWHLDEERDLIDNGRMPVFDDSDTDVTLKWHRTDANFDPDAYAWDNIAAATKNRPGGLMHLPWGQLVFDFFTVLPLHGDGPFGEYPVEDYGDNPIEEHRPRVDLDGLRVHGRINLNAAPWSVLAGLPYVPMAKIPEPFRGEFRATLDLPDGDDNDAKAMAMGPFLAQAIVAYREQRQFNDTGNYGYFVNNVGELEAAPRGRSWTLDTPTIRRGMGFMTVGELANVRHPDAPSDVDLDGNGTLDSARFDLGETDSADGDYVRAVAVPASLGDWVTVRAHVFTIYGTLRGDFDPQKVEDLGVGGLTEKELAWLAEDVDSRALRFQETMDRLPTFVGARTPIRIGKRVLTKYHDVRND